MPRALDLRLDAIELAQDSRVLTGGLPGRFLIHADPRAMAAMVELPHPFVPARVVRPFLRVTDMALRLPGAIRALGRFGGGLSGSRPERDQR